MAGCKTYKVNIYIGLKEGYDGIQHSVDELYDAVQERVDKVGLCVTVTETKYIYRGGREDGVIIGLINYPRFPKEDSEISHQAFVLAEMLMKRFKQYRCTVELPDFSMLMENDELETLQTSE